MRKLCPGNVPMWQQKCIQRRVHTEKSAYREGCIQSTEKGAYREECIQRRVHTGKKNNGCYTQANNLCLGNVPMWQQKCIQRRVHTEKGAYREECIQRRVIWRRVHTGKKNNGCYTQANNLCPSNVPMWQHKCIQRRVHTEKGAYREGCIQRMVHTEKGAYRGECIQRRVHKKCIKSAYREECIQRRKTMAATQANKHKQQAQTTSTNNKQDPVKDTTLYGAL